MVLQLYSGLRAQDLQEAKDQLLVETADMLRVPLFTAEALLRNHGQHLFAHSVIHSFTFIRLFIHSLIHSLAHLLIHLIFHSLIHPLIDFLFRSLIRSLPN